MQIIQVKEKLNAKQLGIINKTLRNGGLVVYPTETCYGIGASCSSEQGVDKLLIYKERPPGKAISIAVTARKMAINYVELNPIAENIYKTFLPGPVTVISKSRGSVDKRLESEKHTLGIRIPNHIIPLQIIEKLGQGITSTSANKSGGKTPYKVSDIINNLSKKKLELIDLIIDYGELPKNPPSIVIDTTLPNPAILRGQDKIGLLQTNDIKQQYLNSWNSSSEKDTTEITTKIYPLLIKEISEKSDSIVILLSGELGVGKTQFVKSLAKSLKINNNITSPTFILERQYGINKNNEGYKTLYHYDLWRLENQEKSIGLSDLGIDTALKGKNIIAIEWPERIGDIAKKVLKKTKNVFELEIDYMETGLNNRKFTLKKLLEN